MRLIALFLTILPINAAAQDWIRLQDDAARAALEGRRVVYDSGAWQEFRVSGATLYNAGRDSWGYWRVRGDQYCSMWPPSDLWACYDLEISGERLRFVGAHGEKTEGSVQD
jgi:hypothetical protein